MGGNGGGDEEMDVDDPFGMGMGGMGMPQQMGRRQRQDPPVIRELEVGLEDIYKGATKKMKITRKVLNGDGRSVHSEDKVLTVNIKPGWKSGTKITFPKEGDKLNPNRIPADVVFVIKDKPHPTFKREGSDIRYVAHITLREALCGGVLHIPTLDGPKVPLPLAEVVKPGVTKRLPGQGLPVSSSPGRRGDLIVAFDIRFPDQLPSGTKEILRDCLP